MRPYRALIGCARSGVLGRAFRAVGWEAWECDREPTRDTENERWHIQGDALWFADNWRPFDLFICHPPCTYLCASGLHWNARRHERAQWTEHALEFALACAQVGINHKCLENPIGILSTRWRKPDQIVQPYQYGDDASKATCLWLNGLPPLVANPAQLVPPRLVPYTDGTVRKRWSNQQDTGQNRLGETKSREEQRSRTYPGIARAMAEQWSAWFAANDIPRARRK